MLINLSNHPSSLWEKEQTENAKKLYGDIVDVSFPQINPYADEIEVINIANDYCENCINLINKNNDKNNAVHIMGEMTFCFKLISLLKEKGIKCIASTTERNVINSPDKTKITQFHFVRFREYII